jgi:hypothetical protein
MQALTFFFAFVAVLALIGVAAWLVRRFAGNRLGANPNRGRMPRLAVIDAAAVDSRRRLVLVRRDNVEHLLMIGGPTDIVVEPNIVRATPGTGSDSATAGWQEPKRRPGFRRWPNPAGTRAMAQDPINAFDQVEPQMPEPPPRPMRPSFADEVRRPMPGLSERRSEPLRSDPLAGFSPEPLGGRPEPRPELRPEPMPSRVTSRNEPLIPRPPRPGEAPKAAPASSGGTSRCATAASAAPAIPGAVERGPKSRRNGATP